jgi:hypothetical protein
MTETDLPCLIKWPLHVHNIQPATMFKTEICSDAYVIETRRSVQTDRASIIAVTYNRHHLLETAISSTLNQRRQQAFAHSKTLMLRRYINRILNCEPIR